MDLTHVYKGSLVKVIADLRAIVPKGKNSSKGCYSLETFESTVRKYIPQGLDGIENFKYEPVKRPSDGKRIVVFYYSAGSTPVESKKKRMFDISKYRRRHIALQVILVKIAIIALDFL